MSEETKSPRIEFEVENKTKEIFRLGLYIHGHKYKPPASSETLAPGQKAQFFLKVSKLMKYNWVVSCQYSTADNYSSGTTSIQLSQIYKKAMLDWTEGPKFSAGDNYYFLGPMSTYKLVRVTNRSVLPLKISDK